MIKTEHRAIGRLIFLVLPLLAGCGANESLGENSGADGNDDGGVNPAPALTLSSVSPSTGSTSGGTTITVTGGGFSSDLAVTLGSGGCLDTQLGSATELTCTAPPHAAGAVDLHVTDSDGRSATLSGAYTYEEPPTPAPSVTSITPGGGDVLGGELVTIDGSDFQAGAVVRIGGTGCTAVNFISSTQLQCTTGSRLKGVVSVVVENPDSMTGTLVNGFTYSGTATYSLLKEKIFTPICSVCHSGPSAPNGFEVLVYSSILSRISPGDAAASLVWQKVDSGEMPDGGPALSTTEVDSIADWINAGGADN